MSPCPTLRALAAATLALLAGACASEPEAPAPPPRAPRYEPPALATGPWRAVLRSPGGELPFGLELDRAHGRQWRATVVNGRERIPVRRVGWDGRGFVLAFDHYDSAITAEASLDGRRLTGRWVKRPGTDREVRMDFEARAGAAPRFEQSAPAGAEGGSPLHGRWRVDFASSEDPAVGIFEPGPAGSTVGTFLTTTGDYRWLAGAADARTLRLSGFDGAHAFLFRAVLREDGTLAGDFWSSARWHERWNARRDDEARLPDAFAQTTWREEVRIGDLRFRDLEGNERALDDPAFAGKARIVYLFGSWCPNCHDATELLAQLHERFGPRGLSIVGLAFEVTGDPARDAAQVRRYAALHGVKWPLLLAGTSDKAAATLQLAALDRVRSYPTTVFLHGDGRVRAVHTGFSGPATGEAHRELVTRFETLIEELLARQ